MNRLDDTLTNLRQRGAKGLMPFVTAGDPDLDATEAVIRAMDARGASVCEVGIPFSDPIADGPVIQASMSRALEKGVRVEQVMQMIERVRPDVTIALVAMVSYSVVHRTGLEAFVKRCKKAGFDGLIFPDLSLEESEKARAAANEADLRLVQLIAPTTPIQRAEQIAKACGGFIYLVARSGVTGARSELPADLPDRIERVRGVTDLPIAVGFGISSAEQVKSVVSVADAAIVGSALVKVIARAAEQGGDAQAVGAAAGEFVGELSSGLS